MSSRMSGPAWPTDQADIDNRIFADPDGAVPQIFIDDDSGEGNALVGWAGNLDLAADNLRAYIQVALEELLSGDSGDVVTLSLSRKDMTEDEVDALPEP